MLKHNVSLALLLSLTLTAPLTANPAGVRRLGAQGPVITPDNVAALVGTIPAEAAAATKTFLAQPLKNTDYRRSLGLATHHTNADAMRQLLTPVMVREDLQLPADAADPAAQILAAHESNLNDKYHDDQIALNLMEVVNLSKQQHNYTFRNPCDPNWLIKIAGPMNRITNLYWAAGFNRYSQEAPNPIQLKNLPTYQTLSEAQVTLILQHEIATKGYRHVRVVPTYLYCLEPDSPETTLNDSNCFLVRRFEPNLALLSSRPDLIADHRVVTPAMVAELKALITVGRLWDIKKNLMIETNTPNPKLVLVDNEQRNLTSPQEFSIVTPETHAWIQSVGLNEAYELFADRPDLIAELTK